MALLSPQTTSQSPSSTSMSAAASPSSIAQSPLPSLVTAASNPISRAATAKNRFSTFSIHSNRSEAHSSRPQSTAFPFFHSTLPYALVRDFAYPSFHPLHYGPSPEEASGISTPQSEAHRRLSDPAPTWDGSRGQWSAGPSSWEPGDHLLTSSMEHDRDGPPWSEDEDLQSPVVTSAKHRKAKSSTPMLETLRGRSFERQDAPRGSYAGTNGDGSETYYVGDQNDTANGPGGEFITYPAAQTPLSRGDVLTVTTPGRIGSRRDSHFAGTLPSRSYHEGRSLHDDDDEDDDNSPPEVLPHDDHWDVDDHRFSRDYQFTIASPDEEMHGKAVALFDFARENENELPLAEGQVVLISYRHGQGWLVAQDPKTGESGLVPEEYVRLLRDIEGGWNGLMNGSGEPIVDSGEAKTPTQESQSHFPTKPTLNTASGEYYVPVVSTFSTSREDFLAHRLGSPALSTPTEFSRRGSEALTSDAFGAVKKAEGAAKTDESDEKSKAADENRPAPTKNAAVKTAEVVPPKVPE